MMVTWRDDGDGAGGQGQFTAVGGSPHFDIAPCGQRHVGKEKSNFGGW
jgi:hypothetical protein